ncbi:MAG TPA: hypothetical protein VN788_13590 [Verrucomicrobiae bacterium]|nr:hypothetical protein [Verrucomicrobiae bacterium]
MAAVDQLKLLFDRDLKFARWEENAKIESSDPNNVDVRLFTETNEYQFVIENGGTGVPQVTVTVRPRKPRAGQRETRKRHLLTLPQPLNEITWRRVLARIVGLELVRVQQDKSDASEQRTDNHIRRTGQSLTTFGEPGKAARDMPTGARKS